MGDFFDYVILFGIPLVLIFILVSKLTKNYEFTNRYVNIVLISIMVLGSPIAIFATGYVSSALFNMKFIEPNYGIKFIIFGLVAGLVAALRYVIWASLFNQKINIYTLHVFSKRYVFQIIYLFVAYFMIFRSIKTVEDEILFYFAGYFLLVSVFIIPIYMFIKYVVLERLFKK